MNRYRLSKEENLHRMARISAICNLYDSDNEREFPRPVIAWSSQQPVPAEPKYYKRTKAPHVSSYSSEIAGGICLDMGHCSQPARRIKKRKR